MTDSKVLMLAVTTVADAAQAEALAASVLQHRLAACISTQTIHSHYVWEGEQQHEQEVQLLFKTCPQRLEALREAVLAQHPYDLPEWLSWPVQASSAYGIWATGQLN
ncbi:divalent-cation tolerance protein CutA [Parasynechococcus sp.]|jgi:periplasmic divalent cation tolerance protein|uniref:divalent-cation tolerance protein CutA n=1 Tax=Parasynechococcus sp. TaxID=3101203 RepID=UPI003704485F